MASIRLLIALMVAGGLWMVGTSTAQAQGVHFHAVLLGGNEVAGGDPNGFGTAAINFDGTSICVAIIVNRIDTPTMAHIHDGFAPVNGPVVIPLPAPPAGNKSSSFACVTIAAALAADIKKNPSRFYVNVHTGAFPGGAVRGQLF